MDGETTDTWLRPAALVLAVVGIVLVPVNAALVLRNQAAQRDVNERQQLINQAAELARVSQLLVATIARTAVANKDDALTQLLETHGVKINAPAPSPDPGQQP